MRHRMRCEPVVCCEAYRLQPSSRHAPFNRALFENQTETGEMTVGAMRLHSQERIPVGYAVKRASSRQYPPRDARWLDDSVILRRIRGRRLARRLRRYRIAAVRARAGIDAGSSRHGLPACRALAVLGVAVAHPAHCTWSEAHIGSFLALAALQPPALNKHLNAYTSLLFIMRCDARRLQVRSSRTPS